jgi:hypothetical protein
LNIQADIEREINAAVQVQGTQALLFINDHWRSRHSLAPTACAGKKTSMAPT